jgi:hypothetical protein
MYEGQRFELRFLRPFRTDLSIRKLSSFLPPLIAATSQRGLAPRPAQVSPDGPRYFGGTFLPLNALLPPRTTLRTTAILLNRSSISARRSRSISSTRSRRSISASTVIPDRFIFGIVISSPLAYRIVRHLWELQILMQIEFGNLAEGDEGEHPQDDETQASCQLPYRTQQNYRHPT